MNFLVVYACISIAMDLMMAFPMAQFVINYTGDKRTQRVMFFGARLLILAFGPFFLVKTIVQESIKRIVPIGKA